MVKPQDWTALQQRVDFIVDGTFGESVFLIPWLGGDDIYTPAEQGPDPSRKMVVTTGVYVTPGANLVGESGRATGGSGGGFNTQVLEQECWLSITSDKLGDASSWVKYDRVYFKKRDKFYNISYIEDSASFRNNVHLIIEHDILTGEGSPLGVVMPVKVYDLYFDILGHGFYKAITTNPYLTNKDWIRL